MALRPSRSFREDGRLDAAGLFARQADECNGSRQDDLCSVGRVRGFIGCIDDLDNFRAMLDARQHQRELILLMCDA